MATIYWEGQAEAVAQVHTGSIDSVDGTPANNTFTVTIGGVAISQVGDTDVATTAAALVVLLNASTHPYFSAITWTNPSAGNIVGTADTAGVPFVAALTETGAGTGAVTDFAETTASSGPNHWGTAANWSGGAVPVNSDVVIIADSSVSICWDLDQSSVSLTSLRIDKSFLGTIGLDYSRVATNASASTTDASKPEYREDYLKIGTSRVDLGQNFSSGSPAGSGRIKIDLGSVASQVNVFDTKSSSSDGTRQAVRFLANSSSTDFYIRQAPGGVGIAADQPGETSTVGDVNVSQEGRSATVVIGEGTTLTNWTQSGGDAILQAAATVTKVDVNNGILTIEGDYTITTLNHRSGRVYDNHIKTGGNSVTTLNLSNDASYDMSRTNEARTIATVNTDVGVSLVLNDSVTLTTNNRPAGTYTLRYS